MLAPKALLRYISFLQQVFHSGKTFFYCSCETLALRASPLSFASSQYMCPFCRLSITGCGNVISHASSAPECFSVFHLLCTISAHI